MRRMPEQGEKFILVGPDWVSPAVFELEGYTGDGAAIIRFADAGSVKAPESPIIYNRAGQTAGKTLENV